MKRSIASEEVDAGTNYARVPTTMDHHRPHSSGVRFAELFTNRAVGPTLQRFLPASALASLRSASGTTWRCLAQLDYLRSLDGREFRVPWPAFPGLNPGLYPHQLASLMAMLKAEQHRNSTKPFEPEVSSTRGGIFADAPGLGKTVTVLALIAHTAGTRPTESPCPADEAAVQAGWDALRFNPMWRENILATLQAVSALVPSLAYGPVRSACENLLRNAQSVVCDSAGKFPTPKHFESFVRSELRRAASLAASDGSTSSLSGGRGMPSAFSTIAALAECAEAFRSPFHDIRASLDPRGRSALAANGPEAARRRLERRLRPSGATLVVVPDELLEHWAEQTRRHLDLTAFDGGSGHGMVFVDGLGDLVDYEGVGQISLNQPLPPAKDLAAFLVVMVPFSRATSEFRKDPSLAVASQAAATVKGASKSPSKRNSSRQKRLRGTKTSSSSSCDGDATAFATRRGSSLLEIRWLRLIIDEGHELLEGDAGLVVFLSELFAERRWVMTGTPTTGDDTASDDGGLAHTARGLDQLQIHLRFLRHPEYGRAPPPSSIARGVSSAAIATGARGRTSSSSASSSYDPAAVLAKSLLATKDRWVHQVKEPFLRGEPAARSKLENLLCKLVVMHRKEDISLPKPNFTVTELSVSLSDAAIADVRATILAHGKMAGAHKLAAHRNTDAFQSLSDKVCAQHLHCKLSEARSALARGAPRPLPTGPGIPDWRPVKCVVYSSSEIDLLSTCAQLDADVQYKHVAQFNSNDGRSIAQCSNDLNRFRTGQSWTRRCPACGHIGSAHHSYCRETLLEVVIEQPIIAAPPPISNGMSGYAHDTMAVAAAHSAAHALTAPVTATEHAAFPGPVVRCLVEPDRIVGSPPEANGGVPWARRGEQYARSPASWRRGDLLWVDLLDPHPVLPLRPSKHEVEQQSGAARGLTLAARDGFEGTAAVFGPLPLNGGRPPSIVTLPPPPPPPPLHVDGTSSSSSSCSSDVVEYEVTAMAHKCAGTYVRDGTRYAYGFPVYVRGHGNDDGGEAVNKVGGLPPAWLWWSQGRWRVSHSQAAVGSSICHARSAPHGVKGFPDTPGLVFEYQRKHIGSSKTTADNDDDDGGGSEWRPSQGRVSAAYPPEQAAVATAPSSMSFAANHLFAGDNTTVLNGLNGASNGVSSGNSEPALCRLARWQSCRKFQQGWFQGPRFMETEAMHEDEDVYLMFLSSQRAAGLDLHFVTDLVLLEPVRDAATMEQVVARAHRLGATGPVRVETLVVLLDLPDDLADLPAVDGDAVHEKLNRRGRERGKKRANKATNGTVVASSEKLSICDQCYRSFPSLALAQQHEAQCPRNPANVAKLQAAEADLSNSGGVPRLESVYRAIKPPPPMATSTSSA